VFLFVIKVALTQHIISYSLIYFLHLQHTFLLLLVVVMTISFQNTQTEDITK